VAGALYLIIIGLGLFGEMARDRVVVGGDAAATAANLRASGTLWRASVAGNLVHLACAVGMAVALYVLFRPVSRELALLATFFELTSIAIEATSKLGLLGALSWTAGTESLRAFEPAQLEALASVSIRSHVFGFGVSLVFFGCACLALGRLIFRSGFLPRALGVLMALAGVCYLVNSFALILAPRLASALFPAILLPAFVGEASLCLWLLIKGVDSAAWQALSK
jgi:hypothetical protein